MMMVVVEVVGREERLKIVGVIAGGRVGLS